MPSHSSNVFVGHSHDSLEREEPVFGFAKRLQKGGMDAQLDQYVAGTPEEGWRQRILRRLDWRDLVKLDIYHARSR